MKLIRNGVLTLVGLILLILLAFGLSGGVPEVISEYTIEKSSIENSIRVFGKAEPETIYTLSFEIGGTVSSYPYKVGDMVKKGSVLARLNSSNIQSNIARAASLVSVEKSRLTQISSSVSPEQLAITEAKILKQKQTIIDAAALLSESVDTARTDLENILDTAIDKEFSSPDDPDASLKMRSVESISDSVRDRLSGIRISISNQITLSEQATEADLKYKYILDATRKTQSLISEMRALLNPKTDFQENAIDTKLELSKSQSESLIATLISPSSAYNSAVNDLAVLEGELVAQESGASIEDKNLQSSVIKSKQAEVNALYSDLSKYRISSPISGEVFQTFVDPFQNVSPTQSVISVIDRNPFVIRANVAESDVVFVGIGNPVDVTFDAITDSTYQAQVTFVESQIDTLRSVPTYETTFVFNEGQDLAKIKSGMTANITVNSGGIENVLALPTSYIQTDNDESYVHVKTSRPKPEKRTVTTGYVTNTGMVEITSGISEGETVLLLSK